MILVFGKLLLLASSLLSLLALKRCLRWLVKLAFMLANLKNLVSKIQNDINNEIKSEELKEQLTIKDEESLLSQTVEEAKSSIDEIKKEAAKISDPSSVNNNS